MSAWDDWSQRIERFNDRRATEREASTGRPDSQSAVPAAEVVRPDHRRFTTQPRKAKRGTRAAKR